jgi:hypothetical protein
VMPGHDDLAADAWEKFQKQGKQPAKSTRKSAPARAAASKGKRQARRAVFENV